MQEEKLRTLIRESIQEYIKEIDEAAETAAMEARIAKCDEAIATRENKLSAIAESDHKDLMDEGKIKGLENEIKELKKAKAKFEKIAEKKAAKKAKKSAPKEEVVTDTMTEEAPVDEADVMAEMDVTDEAVEETAINESFLKMQKLAGVITEAQYNQKKSLIENQLEEISLSGALNKVKDKIASLPAFDKLINSIVAKMSEEDKENFKAKFNLNEAKGAPSLEDIMAKVDAINPNKDAETPEDLKEGAEETIDKIAYEVVRLVKNLTGLNLLALGGIPFGAFIAYLMGSSWGMGTVVGGAISLIASLIIHGICRKLLGLSGDDELVG